ncbi:hypothetical protein D3C81_1444280 [compost metagenome]
MAAIDRIGAGVAQLASGNIGDLVRTGAAMVGTEGVEVAIPQQRIVFQAGHAVIHVVDLVTDSSDAAFDIGHATVDIGHLITNGGHAVVDVGHRVVGGLQLATVDCIGAGITQLASSDVGDLVRAGAAMVGAERTRSGIPQ